MELFVKITITLLVLFVGAKVLLWTWTSQIDTKATVRKLVTKKPSISNAVVTRDPNKLYQNGNIIADVTGPVQISDGTVIFTQLANVSGLDQSKPIEYKRIKLKVNKVQTSIGMKVNVTDEGSETLQSVMEGVSCEEIQE